MAEFELIAEIVERLGRWSAAPWTRTGPGDDATVIEQRAGHDSVASIDTLVAGVHFPVDAPPDLIGYRAMMVSASDLAAMGATPRYCLVALTVPEFDRDWVARFSEGVAAAAQAGELYVCGGNLARGPLSVSVSVHGDVAAGDAVLRSGARAGDWLQVSGPLGGAAACLRMGETHITSSTVLNERQTRYFKPTARLDLAGLVCDHAHAAIDISDGLLQDLSHVLTASGVGAQIVSGDVPRVAGATLADALEGGDDYELLISAPQVLPGCHPIGRAVAESGLWLDGTLVQPGGYDHFRA